MTLSIPKKRQTPSAPAAAVHARLTPDDIHAAEELIDRALRARALYSPEERLVLAVLVANYSRLQRARGKKSKGRLKKDAEYRRLHVNMLLRHVVDQRYRDDPKSLASVMKIVGWLDKIGIEASESQVRRDIREALKLGPLPSSNA